MTRMARFLAAALVPLLLAGSAAGAAVTDEEVRRAADEVRRLRDEADAITRQIEDVWARQYTLEWRIEQLTGDRDAIEAEWRTTLADVESLAVELYMDAASGENLAVMMAPGSAEFAAGLEYLRAASGDEEDALDHLSAVRGELDRTVAELEAAVDEQEGVSARLADLAGEVQATLAAAQSRYDELAGLRAEQLAATTTTTSTTTTTTRPTTTSSAPATTSTTAPATTTSSTTTTSVPAPTTTTSSTTTSTSTTTTTTTTVPATTTTTVPTTTTTTVAVDPSAPGGGACPVAGPVSFVDTWGAPRSGGRTHEGVDMMAQRGTPVAAIFSGVLVQLRNSTLGGITIWMRSDAGDEYYYAHLEGYAPGTSEGMRVEEGEIIAYVGTSGNAPDYLPHLHFEYHPGGGAAVDPYPLVKAICG